jgi:hypothetical protein
VDATTASKRCVPSYRSNAMPWYPAASGASAVDTDRVVALAPQRGNQPARCSGAHVQHVGRRAWQLGVNKGPGGVQPAVARGGGHRSDRRRDLERVAACGDAGSSRAWTGGVGGPVALGDLRSAERRAVCRGRAREALPDQSSRGLQHLKEAVLCPATWRARGAVPDQTGGGRGSCAPTWTGCGTTRLSRSWRPWNTSSVRRTEPADLRTRGPNRHRGRVPGAGPQGVHRAVRHLAAKGVQHRRGRHGSAQRAG